MSISETISELKKYLLQEIDQESLKVEDEINNVKREFDKDEFEYKKFNFIQKKIFKKKFDEYTRAYNDNQIKKSEKQQLIRELEENKNSINLKRNKIENADSFNELGFNDTESAIKFLIENNIDPKFESYSQAFELAPNYLGNNIIFMKNAIKENVDNIVFDKTNDESLYADYLKIKIEELSHSGDILIESKLNVLNLCLEELKNPKNVEHGKYKVPHKYMFEEIRKFKDLIRYPFVDGIYNEEFGRELEDLYNSPDYFLGIHGSITNYQDNIFRQGLKNSMQNASTHLVRTVAYGRDLTFTRTLNYLIPYNGLEAEANYIVMIPNSAFDSSNPTLIWGSDSLTGDDNYLLPQYVYGVYYSIDGSNRKIIRNNHDDMVSYRYFKSDVSSGNPIVVDTSLEEINTMTR